MGRREGRCRLEMISWVTCFGAKRPFPTFPSFPILRCTQDRLFPTMKPPTDYIRHAARLARKLQMDAAMGGTPQPDAEFYKTLSKALDEIAAGLELVAKAD